MSALLTASGSFNPAAPGPIGGTTAGSGAFTDLTASSTLGVTGATTLTGGLTVGLQNSGPQSGALLATNSSLSDYASGTTLNLGSNGPSIATYYLAGAPTKWIAINDNGTTRYIPTWHDDYPPPPPP